MKAIINFEELKKGKSSRGQLPGLAEESIGGMGNPKCARQVASIVVGQD